MATFVSASANNLSLITVDVTFLPSRPASGESFTVIVIDMVGGSMGVEAIGSVTSRLQIVSATEASANPAIHIMSPVCTSFTATLSVPSNLNNLVNLPDSTCSPLRLIALTLSLTLAVPCSTRPTKHLPRYGSESNNVDNIAKGLLDSTFGGST